MTAHCLLDRSPFRHEDRCMMNIDSNRRRLLAAVPALLLLGCGPGRKSGFLSPRVSLAGVDADAQGWQVRVRIQNVVDRIMTIERIDLRLLSGAQRLDLDLAGQKFILPPYATEVLTVAAPPQVGLLEHLRLSTRRPGGVAYRLEGYIHTIEPSRRFEVEYEGFLSAVPGREGSYR
jgi:hypothetical protein